MKLSEEEMGRFQGLIDGLVDFGVTAGILAAKQNPTMDPAVLRMHVMQQLEAIVAVKFSQAAVVAQIRGDLEIEKT